jgi:hypothetical protein
LKAPTRSVIIELVGDKSFVKSIGDDGDKRLRFRIRTRKGKVVEFVVQLELRSDGGWKPVVRYDNAHGFAHRDVLDPRGELVEKKVLKLATLAEVLEFAEQDLSDRFEWYVERFLKMRKVH